MAFGLATLACVLLGSKIGRAAGVVVVGSCRVHKNQVIQTLCLDLVAKHAMRRRAAADVAHAHKKNGIRFRLDHAVLKRWLFRVRSMKSSGLVFTQATNSAMSGCANRASTELNCLASSVSVNKACIWRWQIRCRNSVCRPPLDFGTR